MTESIEQKGLWQKIKEFLFPPREEYPRTSQSQTQSKSDQGDDKRFSVKDASGNQVDASDSLAEAHRRWQQLTEQKGSIVDTESGEDVTPEPDDNGRYVVMDKSGNQLESFGNREAALESWRQETQETGSVIDTETNEDITAAIKGFLTKEQLDEVISRLGTRAGKGKPSHRILGIEPNKVAWYAEQINRMQVPVFNMTNTVGKKDDLPTKTVPIKRRKVTIETKRRIVEVEAPGPPSPSQWVRVPYPTDQQEMQPIRRTGDISRVSASDLAKPEELLYEGIARRTLRMAAYDEEVPGAPTVKKRKVWQEYEEPKVEEWTEEVEISDEPRAQLVELIVDVSGSMGWDDRMNLAVAVAILLVGKHLNDGSRYYFRQFANIVGAVVQALDDKEKRKFLTFLVNQKDTDLGGGTEILIAVRAAAQDVRSAATSQDRAEVLLITDGDDTFGASDLYRAIGEDVTLHTIIVGPSGNESLKRHSSTYFHLWARADRTVGSTDQMHREFRVPLDDDW